MVEITSKEQLLNVLQTETKPVLVDFWATWCGPCRSLGNTLLKLNTEKYCICKINVDTNKDIASEYNIKSVPTVFIYKGNELKHTFNGNLSEKEIIEKLDNC